MFNWAVFWEVTTSEIKEDWSYILNVESNASDIEYRNCLFLQQPEIYTFPKVWDTVVVMILWNWEYVVLWTILTNAKKYFAIGEDNIKLDNNNLAFIWNTITANWEDLTIDNIW